VNSSRKSHSDYLPTLDGWRAIAISAVIVYHVTHSFWMASSRTFPGAKFYSRASWGAYGVDIFFAISGFLICSRLIEEYKRNHDLSLPSFYVRRVFRIIPPALCYLSVLFLFSGRESLNCRPSDLLSSLLFFRNYIPAITVREWNPTSHFWSLSVEEHFYLLWPGLLATAGIRRARILVVPLALGIALWRAMAPHVDIFPGVYLWSRTDVRLDGLLWGCWTALILEKEQTKIALTRFISPIALLVLGPAVLLCVLLKSPLASAVLAFLLPFILLTTVLHPESTFGRVLEWWPIRWLGRISYSVYLWQQLFLSPTMFAYPIRIALLRLPLILTAILACSAASFFLIEQPMIEMGRRLARRFKNSKDESLVLPITRVVESRNS
jgi:peptidoglycan/LPS O-acetylase OafA/YrhL